MRQHPDQYRQPLTVVVFVAITVPLMVHTAQLLLQITSIRPRWLAYAYAAFFAVGFDLAVFMFSLYDLKGAKKTFATMAGVVGFFFFNLGVLFEQLPAAGWASGRLWAQVVLGSMFAVVGAYLVYHSTELINQVFASRPPLSRARATRTAQSQTVGVSHDTVPPPTNGESQHEKIILLKQEGKTNAEISRQLGISDRTVRRKLKTLEDHD